MLRKILLSLALVAGPASAQVQAQWSYSAPSPAGVSTAAYPGNVLVQGNVQTTGNIVVNGTATLSAISGTPAFSSITATGTIADNPSYTGLNSTLQATSANVGGCLSTDYLSGSSGNFTTSAVVGCIVQPAGSYSGTTGWPDAAISGYVVTSNASQKSSVGVYGTAGATVAGASLYGGNFTTVNCRLWASACTPGGGFDFAVMYGLEVDVNSYSKSGSVAPAGAARGFIAHLNGDLAPTTSAQAYDLTATGGAQWGTGYTTEAAATPVGVYLNSSGASNVAGASQSIQLISRGAAGSPTTSTISVASGGNLSITSPTLTMSGPTTLIGTATVSANANATLPPTCGGAGFAMTDNYISGSAEGDLINCATGGTGFAMYQMTSPSAATQIFRVDAGGNVTTAAVITAGSYILLKSYTVATLPTCNAGLKGGLAYVTDATSPSYNIAPVGGGAVAIPVFCNGTGWTAH